MRSDTRAGLAFVAVLSGCAPLALASTPTTHGWQSEAPAVANTENSTEIINPLFDERESFISSIDDSRADREAEVNFDFGAFGTISAAQRIGTLEHAYSQFAYTHFNDQTNRDSALPQATENPAEQRNTSESLGIEFTDETSYEVHRILNVLFKGVDRERASIYHTWAQSLSTKHLDAALEELALLVQKIETLDSPALASKQATDIRRSPEYQQTLAQLRKSQRAESINKPTLKELDRLRGIISSHSENSERDFEALRDILIGRIVEPVVTPFE